MTPDKLLDAIGMLDERFFEEQHKPRIVSLKQKFTALLAAVLIIILSIATAMAVSPDFRELVFRFFHIEQTQVIPDSSIGTDLSVDDMFAEDPIIIGDVIEGNYVHTPVSTHARSGIYIVCTDEVEMRQGSHYDGYYIENGEFIKLEEHTFQQNYTLYGNDLHLEFDWVEHNGAVSITYVEPNDIFRKDNESGDASAALFTLQLTWQDEEGSHGTSYPVLLNLHTGELTDILAGTGVNKMPRIDKSAISPDHTKLLLGQNTEEGYFLHYVDLTNKQVYSIDELSGQHTTACSLMDNTLACWSLQEDHYTAWKIDLTTLERSELFASVSNAAATPEADAGIVFMEGFDGLNRWGDMYIGSRFALEVDEAQNVYVIDLTTGAKTQINGYTWRGNTQRTPSPDGRKLLLAGGGAMGSDFEYVGVLNFDTMMFAEFSRENELDEYLAYWFDKDTVIICSDISSESLCSDYYLYRLRNDT